VPAASTSAVAQSDRFVMPVRQVSPVGCFAAVSGAGVWVV
jgi:hypothetical protein